MKKQSPHSPSSMTNSDSQPTQKINMLRQTYISETYDTPVPVPPPKPPLDLLTLQTIHEDITFEEEYEEPKVALSCEEQTMRTQCCGTKYNYLLPLRTAVILIVLFCLMVILVGVLVVTGDRQNHGGTYQYIVDVQYGARINYLDDLINQTLLTENCQVALTIGQTKICSPKNNLLVSLMDVDLNKTGTLEIEYIAEEYNDCCHSFWKVTAIVDSDTFGPRAISRSCLCHDENDGLSTKSIDHDVRVKVSGDS